jgi:hypothetical protein
MTYVTKHSVPSEETRKGSESDRAVLGGFDYGLLSVSEATAARRNADRINVLESQRGQAARTIGKLLLETKAVLKTGQFEAWVTNEAADGTELHAPSEGA